MSIFFNCIVRKKDVHRNVKKSAEFFQTPVSFLKCCQVMRTLRINELSPQNCVNIDLKGINVMYNEM